ncbi:tetratricopeptide repeat protein [Fulvivirga ulvae]|uniref:tetratricopeptide repeat protein n=1 Tax=Fulvivirga ulvae TaxID=2904245 RepID=UPI001F27E0EB|nr:tetratricopeptide repeat protein [Fulvivirga ulvae]UII29928.1 tetratricopeptide repeat protein [Fulvivirga ulvae]
METNFQAPVLTGMGEHTMEITTESIYTQRFFKQGLILAYGFNHAEAIRSFKEAIRQDDECAMCYWGLAYALGPNYNVGMDESVNQEAYNAAQMALKLADDVTQREKHLIKAMAERYAPEFKNRKELDRAYAEAMRMAYEAFPEDSDIAAIYAESLMDLHPWDLYTAIEGEPKIWTPEIVKIIEQAMESNPRNPMPIHLYIHATEASSTPERALDMAMKLGEMVPGAGHLVHMPSHTYIRTGDYHLGTLANERAVEVDSSYLASCSAQGLYPLALYPHNLHFLTACAALEGNGAKAINAAFRLAQKVDRQAMKQKEWAGLQHFSTIQYNVLVKFAQWETILQLWEPELDYPKAIWHYARGMAYVGLGKTGQAQEELDLLTGIAGKPGLREISIWDINTVDQLVLIAQKVLDAEILRAGGQHAEAEIRLKQAIGLEDRLNYQEPPDWFFSVRHVLGDLYMQMGQYSQAENIYREDLKIYRKNGFALHGLKASLLHQGKVDEAVLVGEEFRMAWKYADTQLKYSRVNPETRKNIKTKMQQNLPGDLISIALTFCGFDR